MNNIQDQKIMTKTEQLKWKPKNGEPANNFVQSAFVSSGHLYLRSMPSHSQSTAGPFRTNWNTRRKIESVGHPRAPKKLNSLATQTCSGCDEVTWWPFTGRLKPFRFVASQTTDYAKQAVGRILSNNEAISILHICSRTWKNLNYLTCKPARAPSRLRSPRKSFKTRQPTAQHWTHCHLQPRHAHQDWNCCAFAAVMVRKLKSSPQHVSTNYWWSDHEWDNMMIDCGDEDTPIEKILADCDDDHEDYDDDQRSRLRGSVSYVAPQAGVMAYICTAICAPGKTDACCTNTCLKVLLNPPASVSGLWCIWANKFECCEMLWVFICLNLFLFFSFFHFFFNLWHNLAAGRVDHLFSILRNSTLEARLMLSSFLVKLGHFFSKTSSVRLKVRLIYGRFYVT